MIFTTTSCSTEYDENRDDIFCCVNGYQLIQQSKEIHMHSCVVSKNRSVFVSIFTFKPW